MFRVMEGEKGLTGVEKKKTATTATVGSHEDPVLEVFSRISFFFFNNAANIFYYIKISN